MQITVLYDEPYRECYLKYQWEENMGETTDMHGEHK
jgi:hypothetical protein